MADSATIKSTRVVITVFDGLTGNADQQAFGGLVMKTMPIASPVEFDLSLRHINSIFADARFTVSCDQAEEHAVVQGADRVTFDVWYLAQAFGGQPRHLFSTMPVPRIGHGEMLEAMLTSYFTEDQFLLFHRYE